MARLSMYLLGSFQVTLDGTPVAAFESDKVRALLAYLAAETERPQRRERLAGLLWPERAERAARTNLRHVLAQLRPLIGDRDASSPFLCITHQTIQFNRASDAWVDVTAFTDMVQAATTIPLNPRADEDTVRRLEDAVALYRGRFLEGFSLPDAALFEEWMLLTAERLQRLLVDALERLSGCYEARGVYERALPHAWRQVELEPWQEQGQRRLMRLLALSGQRGAALARYEACRRLLAEELGCPPSPKTQELVEQIKKGALAGLPAPSQTPSHNLPAPLTPFIGRETELAAVKDCLEEPGCRLLTLVGPGGSGKTRLALEAARTQLQNFDGVYLVSLAPLRSTDGLVPALAEALNLPFYAERPPKQQLLDYVRQKRVLLILDNMEHLLDGAGLVVDLLRAAPGLKILSTSRAKLNLKGETQYAIAGMKYPHAPPCTAQDASQYSAVELFVSSARRARPGFALRASNLPHVVHICRLVEGMPLGILLAAAWVGALSAAEIASQLAHDAGQALDLLRVDWGDVPARHRSLRAVFDRSWRLLTPRERGVFQALSVFRGGFAPGAAQAVAGAALQDLMSLAGKSFLQRDAGGRYQVHELLRQYAAEKLDRSPAASIAAHERYCAYYTAALETWGVDLKGAGQQAALAALDQEIENARAAWDWAAGQGQVARLEQALEGLCRFYSWRLRHAEGEAACRLAVEGLKTVATGDGLRLLARILAWQSAFSAGLGRGERASELLEQSQAYLERPGLADWDTRPERAFLLYQRGQRAFGSDWGHARRLYEQSLALYRALGDDWWAASVLDRLGWLATYLSSFGEAIRRHRQALALRRALGDTIRIADSLRSLGAALHAHGRLEEAERHLREGFVIWQELEDRLGIAL